MCACLRQVSSLLTLKQQTTKQPQVNTDISLIPSTTQYIYLHRSTQELLFTIPTNPIHQFICCYLCCLCDACCDVPYFIPFLFAFRSEVPTKIIWFCFSAPPVVGLISVMHYCCFNRCQSSTNRSVSVLHFRRFCRYFTVIFLLLLFCYLPLLFIYFMFLYML